MRHLIFFMFFGIICLSCKNQVNIQSQSVTTIPRESFTEVLFQPLEVDSASIRALEVNGNSIVYSGSNGLYGILTYKIIKDAIEKDSIVVTKSWSNRIKYEKVQPSFRSVASTGENLYFMAIGNPALLYQHSLVNNQVTNVYKESDANVFYDAMDFWNDKEGIAMGDPTSQCLSILITRDGGVSWTKIPCEQLPKSKVGEAAFAASDTNIKIIDDHTWILTGGKASRIFYSADKGRTWSVYETPLIQGTSTQGGYSLDFYDKKMELLTVAIIQSQLQILRILQ